MNKFLTLSAPTALLSGLLLATGCSSSGDGGSGAGAGVPANAITIADSTHRRSNRLHSCQRLAATVFKSVFGIETQPPLRVEKHSRNNVLATKEQHQ